MKQLLQYLFGSDPLLVLPSYTDEHIFSYSISEQSSALQKRGLLHLDALVALSDYHSAPVLQQAIHAWKYGGVRRNGRILAQLFAQHIPCDEWSAFAVCPVPLHWTRTMSRGFNQAAVLARALSSKHDIPYVPLLKRKKATGHLAHCTKVQRFLAIENAFICTNISVPSRIILVDDLSTTGATLDACAQVLKQHGAEKVVGCVLAHG